MDRINLLSNGEKAVAGGGLLILLGSFFPWWKFSVGGLGSVSRSGWGAPGEIWSILAILIALALAGSIIAMKFGNVQMPALPNNLTWGQAYGGGAAAVVILMLLKAWRISAVGAGGFDFGFFIALIGTVAIAYGGYLLYMEEKGGSTA